MEYSAKITSKGQVTIPKKIRDMLKTNVVCFKIENGRIYLEPVRDVGGALKKYAKKKISHDKERAIAWEKVADEYRDIS